MISICFVFMLGCCSIVSCCMLSSIVLLIAALCHSCFACHLQTVHPFPVILISISTEIISSFQRHTWFAKLMPCSSFFLPKHAYALHITSRISWHVLHHVACALHRDLLWFLACVLALGRVGRRVRDRGTYWVRLRGSSFRLLWELCRQDDHTLEITSIFACSLFSRLLRRDTCHLLYHASHIAMSSL